MTKPLPPTDPPRRKPSRPPGSPKAKPSGEVLRRMEDDLGRAAEIQKRLLPASDPRLAGFEVSGGNLPCYEVGGDYYDFVPLGDDRLVVAIADVSGKGMGAALLMASLRAALHAEVRPGFEPADAAARLNDFLHRSSEVSSFATFFLGDLDRRTGVLRYVNAGHNPPFVLRAGGTVESLPPSGFALGMFAGARYAPGAVTLGPGDLAVLFTDGIPEARDRGGTEFTEERLRRLAAERRGLPAADLARMILDEAHAFGCGCEPCDDITVVVIKRV